VNTARFLAALAPAGMFAASGLPFASHNASFAARTGAPVRGGTMIDGLFEEPDRLIPNTSSMSYAAVVDDTLFAPLLYTDDKGVMHTGLVTQIPTLANGGISRDGLSYTFHFRPGLTWSDGQPLDARDLDFSWRLWLNKDLIVSTTSGLDQIASADVSADNLSITSHLKHFFAPFVSVWADEYQPLPAHVFKDLTAKQVNTSKENFQPSVDRGPFIIASRMSGDHITEAPNPHYYQAGMPYLSKLIFRIIPNSTAIVNALKAHEIDASWFLDIAQATILANIPGYSFIPAYASNYEIGLLNLHNPIFQDVRVRQALEDGLDRPSMAKDVWHGEAPLIASDQVPSVWTYDSTLKPYPFDLAKAAQLLDAAGWKLGSDGLRHKNGKTLSIRWSTTAQNQWRAQDELIALQDYANLGIQLNIVNYPGDSYFGSILPGGKYDIGEFEDTQAYDPDAAIYNLFNSTQTPPKGVNWSYYRNPAYDTLMSEEENSADSSKRLVIFRQMQRVMAHDMPALWMYSPPNLAEYNNHLHNYMPGPFSGETRNSWEWWKDVGS
jgi:peptide/nickel transport system substrate-binding protein